MSSQEKDPLSNREKYDNAALDKLREAHETTLREKLEKSAEKHHETQAEDARKEALEQASSTEKKYDKQEKGLVSAHERRPVSKREREASYDRTMDEVRTQLSAPSRAFSNFIHNPAVEKVSDALGGTVARPNAILSGAMFAFLFTLVVYIVARLYGYPLSGTETIASFGLGWVLGLVFDYIRLLVFGKNR
ncbi:MAG: hypothetical protein WBP22_05085 [Candidatus Saccharimonas sp.]